MPFRVTFFNVRHGDSIVIEEIKDDQTITVVLIDSNIIKDGNDYTQPAFNYLKYKGISEINAIVITHFDKDHFTGIELFLNEFDIKKVFIPPVLSIKSSSFNKKLSKFKEQIIEKSKLTNDPDVRKPRYSFASLLAYIKEHVDCVEEINGREMEFRIPGMAGISGKVFLPVAKLKGIINQKIESPDFDIDVFAGNNEISLAIMLEIGQTKIMFSGDSERRQWNEHSRQMRHYGIHSLDADILKAPHHGSKDNNTEKVYDYLLGDEKAGKHVIVSANGRSHPHAEFFSLVEKLKLNPLCTNISKYCYSNVLSFSPKDDLPSIIKRYIQNYEVSSKPVPCQGDISFDFHDDGYSYSCSNSTPCVYAP